MNTKTKGDPCQGVAPFSDAGATRRLLIAALPLVAAASDIALWKSSPVEAGERLPVGEAAALLALSAITGLWTRPDGFVVAIYQQSKRLQLRSLLISYAGIHSARLGTEACASHMLSAADVMSQPPCTVDTLRARGDDEGNGLGPAKFLPVWRRARLIELERPGAQLARLMAVNS